MLLTVEKLVKIGAPVVLELVPVIVLTLVAVALHHVKAVVQPLVLIVVVARDALVCTVETAEIVVLVHLIVPVQIVLEHVDSQSVLVVAVLVLVDVLMNVVTVKVTACLVVLVPPIQEL